MIVKKINTINDELADRMTELAGLLDDREMDIKAAIEVMRYNMDRIGIFGAFREDVLMGFALAEQPGPIYPHRAFLWLTAVDKTVPRKVSDGLFEMACRWCITKGATYLWGWTKRNPEVLRRLYGFEAVKERQIIKPLVGDDHLKVERDTNDTVS